MKALIIYQDFASAAKASAALQHSAHHYLVNDSEVRVDWEILPWRVDMLKFPPMAAEALAEALDVHLMVFIGSCAQSIPGWLHVWLEEWAAGRQVADAALAVMGDENAAGFNPSAIPELFQFARRHGLNVIFDDHGASDRGAGPASDSMPRLTLPITPMIPPGAGKRDWGLNE